MATQIDTMTASPGDATATPAGASVVVAPSDASLAVLYFGTSGPKLATAQSPYSTWATQGIGASTTRNSQAMVGHAADDNLQAIVTSPANGPYYFTFTRSGNVWSQSAVGATGDANNAANGNIGASMWVGKDPQGRLWYVGVDDVLATYVPAAGWMSTGGVWTMDTTLEATSLGENNHRGIAAAIIGAYLVVVYDSGSGALSYRRRDVSGASLGAWSTAAAITGVSGISTSSALSLRAIPGGSTGMLAYSGSGGIKGVSYDASTDTWGSVTTLSAASSDRHPALIAGASGVIYAVWAQFAAANSYALVGSVYASGAWSGSVTTLEAAGANIAWPNGAYLASGSKLALVWTQGAASPWAIEFDAVAAPAAGGGTVSPAGAVSQGHGSGVAHASIAPRGAQSAGVGSGQAQASILARGGVSAGVGSGVAHAALVMTAGASQGVGSGVGRAAIAVRAVSAGIGSGVERAGVLISPAGAVSRGVGSGYARLPSNVAPGFVTLTDRALFRVSLSDRALGRVTLSDRRAE